jgi:hypothetical protein
MVWNSADADDTGRTGGLWDDVQIRPNADQVLVSHCGTASCLHALYSLTDGSMLRGLPELTANRAKFSPKGNWVVSGTTLLHLPDGQQRVLDPAAVLAAFVPNGDVIALLAEIPSRDTAPSNETLAGVKGPPWPRSAPATATSSRSGRFSCPPR